MSAAIIQLEYKKLLGAWWCSQLPYAWMIGCGYFFAKVQLIKREGLISFGKMVIEIFLPTYFFIQVCRSSYSSNYEDNAVIIVSFLVYFAIAFAISFWYAFWSKMDLRYRYTFITITSFVDIKRWHYWYVNCFCFWYERQSNIETAFCNKKHETTVVQLFFQGILIWYVGFNLIRIDRNYQRKAMRVWDLMQRNQIETEEMKLETEANKNDSYFRNEDEQDKGIVEKKRPVTTEEQRELKDIFHSYRVVTKQEVEEQLNINNILPETKGNHMVTTENGWQTNSNIPREEDIIRVAASRSFYNKIDKYHNIHFERKSKWYYEALYVLWRSPLIGLFVGFIVGFITVIREWLFDTTTPVFLFFDTFNNIANANVFIGFWMVGANWRLAQEDSRAEVKETYRPVIRKIDYIMHFIIKILIMPFLGVVFSWIVNRNNKAHNIWNWTVFIQWMWPSSLDLLSIAQVKDINSGFIGVSIAIQYFAQMVFNNWVHVPCFLKVIDALN